MKRILYIYGGQEDKKIHTKDDEVSLYQLSVGKITGPNVCSINDHVKLNQIATRNVGEYSEFVFSQNREFIRHNLIYKGDLSLYFLTDFSCKRSEMFPTYSNMCNALFIKSYITENNIEQVIFDGCAADTFEAMSSVIGGIEVKKWNVMDSSLNYGYVFLKNCVFFIKLIIALLLKRILFSAKNIHEPSLIDELFLTRYPLHLNDNLYEDKYGRLVGDKGIYLINLFTDGLHQNLTLKGYLKAKHKLTPQKKVRILDDYLSLKDITSSFIYSVILMMSFRPLIKKKFILDGIDLTKSIKNELYFSLIRLPRLLMWKSPIAKFIRTNTVKKIYYYLHEYSYGRLITFQFKSLAPHTKTIGFQHGPASLRKMVYMAANNELSPKGDGISSFPLPDKVLAEDEFSRTIYIRSGYQNVKVMDSIYRLDYLKKVNRSNSLQNVSLIAPGLHDGEFLMMTLCPQIEASKNVSYILKVHPRANNSYVAKFSHLANLSVSDETIISELSKVDKVYATYSSVAIEAHCLGIDVKIVEVPGKVNESPLIDRDFVAKV